MVIPDSKEIPLQKLVEYAKANSPGKRTSILTSLFDESEYRVDRYGLVHRSLALALSSSSTNSLDALKLRLNAKNARSVSHANRLKNAEECCEHAKFLINNRNLQTLQFRVVPVGKRQFVIESLEVTVNPSGLLFRSGKDGKMELGGLKLYTPKTKELDKSSAELIGVGLHWFLEAFFAKHYTISPRICLVADVFRERLWSAPDSHARRRKELMHACQEINDRWESVAQRAKRSATEPKSRHL